MGKSKQIPVAWYAVTDFITAALAWGCFYFIRKLILKETIEDAGEVQVNSIFWLGILFIPVGWLILYALTGAYHSLYKKSRLLEFTTTFVCTLAGSIILFSLLYWMM
ncbi:MAG: hypothetical protein WDN26_09285 [Chitinophagaceae bacterium]